MISGEYEDIRYSIEYIVHPSLGAYDNIRLILDGKLIVLERELNPIRAIDTLARSIKVWSLDEEIIVISHEKAQEHIK